MGYSIPVSIKLSSYCGGGGGQNGQGMLVLPPLCEIFRVRTLVFYVLLVNNLIEGT